MQDEKPLSFQPEHDFLDEPLAIEGGEFLPMQEMEKDIVLCIGAGDIAQEISRLAKYAGFMFDVIDTRPDFAKHERFPAARQVLHCQSYADIEKRCHITSRHYLIVATEDTDTNLFVLKNILHSKARYIGVQGTETKKDYIFNALRKDGVPAAELACICCPIGLPIGAERPAEVSIAIMAELIAARSGCLAGPRSKQKARRK